MAWFQLFIAGLFEIIWAVTLKDIDSISNIKPIVITMVGMIISFSFLSIALKKIPIGTGYAIWTGIGAVGVAIYGIIFQAESTNIIRIICLALIVIGILGVKFFTQQKN
ncbi:DMT family transporter [Fluviispira multicolorata]|uniref:Guanidinium exporter n=1 Tax=Fluviispira multicolorata TaxID=2654512 RepID=A0A833JCM9_9BACT|nr:multidrug efflux SMR transporter [Fluviispira multicolorata]KAB8030823.1 QacE family quaternary ammonium compound efflux SMR transporter [Fluviispira multicolorata]